MAMSSEEFGFADEFNAQNWVNLEFFRNVEHVFAIIDLVKNNCENISTKLEKLKFAGDRVLSINHRIILHINGLLEKILQIIFQKGSLQQITVS